MKKIDMYKDELNFLKDLTWFRMNHKVRERIDRRIAFIEVEIDQYTKGHSEEQDGN
jgi:hypothetical protein|tara:strand:+ start:879 stop:1046 length:168 start_codon:yes stop_codon:yes gene_type:complete